MVHLLHRLYGVDAHGQYKQPKRSGDLDLESGVRVVTYVGYLCANFSLPRPLFST